MGIGEKARSLFAGMPGGGFQFKTDPAGVLYLPPESMPYELERIFVRWAEAQPATHQSAIMHTHDGVVLGISTQGWEGFASWLLDTLRAAQN